MNKEEREGEIEQKRGETEAGEVAPEEGIRGARRRDEDVGWRV